jgi:hypothetical protein
VDLIREKPDADASPGYEATTTTWPPLISFNLLAAQSREVLLGFQHSRSIPSDLEHPRHRSRGSSAGRAWPEPTSPAAARRREITRAQGSVTA